MKENHAYIEDDTLVLKFKTFSSREAQEARVNIGKSILELVQQRSEDFNYNDPVYYALEVVEACLNVECPDRE